MYRALYRKWRPRNFDDVCGQDQVVDILKFQVANNKISHAYLFCGSRGTGKTSCAKILAKAVNCLNPKDGNPCNECVACMSIDNGTATDVIEMDAASNTGVDNVRDIKEDIVFAPAQLRYRVYIIDEVHMMSGNAFNALLKTLEEPPSHALFILATTELHKLPSTIVSRCQHYEFRRLSTDVLIQRLFTIADAEKIDLEQSGAAVIAKAALGGMRDAVSLLELCAGRQKKIDERLATETLGLGNREVLSRVVRAIRKKDYSTIYSEVEKLVMSSTDISVFWQELSDYYRDMMICHTTKDAQSYVDLTGSEFAALSDIASTFTVEELLYHTQVLQEAYMSMQRQGASRRTVAELALVRMCEERLSTSTEALLLRISKLENTVSELRGQGFSIAKSEEKPKMTPTEAPFSKPEPPQRTKSRESASEGAYKKLACWSEVVEKLIELKPSMIGALTGTTAFVSDSGELRLYVENDFYKNLLMRDDTKTTILRLVGDESGKAPHTVLIECSQKNEDDILNELLKSVQG